MLIVFDLDGTLSDSAAAIVATFQHACRDHGHAEPNAADIAARIGLPLDRMFRELVPGGDVGVLTPAYKERYLPWDAELTRLFDGVHPLLDGLDGTLAIATSKSTAGAERTVNRLGLQRYFTEVMGHDAVPNPKPAPDMLLELMRRTGVGPDRTLMVGDTTFDLDMADAAGVRGVGVSWGSHGADGLAKWPVARDPAHLRQLLEQASR